MKAYLSFKLPEEQQEHDMALNGPLYKFILQDLDNELRNKLKYEENLSNEVRQTLEDIRQMLHNLCDEKDLSIW